MPSIGWIELLTIGVVAIVVVGPRELPGLLRQIGELVGFARKQVQDAQSAMTQLADDLDLEDTRKAVRELRKTRNLSNAEARKKFLESIGPDGETGDEAGAADHAGETAPKPKPATAPISAGAPARSAATHADPATRS